MISMVPVAALAFPFNLAIVPLVLLAQRNARRVQGYDWLARVLSRHSFVFLIWLELLRHSIQLYIRKKTPINWWIIGNMILDFILNCTVAYVMMRCQAPKWSSCTEYQGPSISERLPQELIDIIIDELHASTVNMEHYADPADRDAAARQSLSSVALISSVFRYRSQHHMFRVLTLRSAGNGDGAALRRLRDITTSVQGDSHIVHHLRHLKIEVMPKHQPYYGTSLSLPLDLTRALNAIRYSSARITSLSLSFNGLRISRAVEAAHIFKISRYLNSFAITSLYIHNVSNLPEQFLATFPHLRNISFDRLRAYYPGEHSGLTRDRSIGPSPPQITSLHVSGRSLSAVMHMLGIRCLDEPSGSIVFETSCLDVSRLETLSVQCHGSWDHVELSAIVGCIISSTPRLSKLIYEVETFECPAPDQWPPILLGLDRLSSITLILGTRSTELFRPIKDLIPALQHLSHLLDQVRSRRLICITIQMPMIHFQSEDESGSLSRMLFGAPWSIVVGNIQSIHSTLNLRALDINIHFTFLRAGIPSRAPVQGDQFEREKVEWDRIDERNKLQQILLEVPLRRQLEGLKVAGINFNITHIVR